MLDIWISFRHARRKYIFLRNHEADLPVEKPHCDSSKVCSCLHVWRRQQRSNSTVMVHFWSGFPPPPPQMIACTDDKSSTRGKGKKTAVWKISLSSTPMKTPRDTAKEQTYFHDIWYLSGLNLINPLGQIAPRISLYDARHKVSAATVK